MAVADGGWRFGGEVGVEPFLLGTAAMAHENDQQHQQDVDK
jgi:hypothetical protein